MEELSNSMLSIESLLSTLDGNPEFLHHRVTRGAKKCPPVKTTGFSPFAFLAFILISINTISNISNNISNNNNNNNNNNDDNNNNNLFNSNNKSERRKRKGLQIPGIYFWFSLFANTLLLCNAASSSNVIIVVDINHVRWNSRYAELQQIYYHRMILIF